MVEHGLRAELKIRGLYMQPGVIENVTSWKIVAQAPTNTTVPVIAAASPVLLALTAQPAPALALKLNPVEVTVPFKGPCAMAVSGQRNLKVLPSNNFL